jgi:Epoxide hydrolase N terminus
MVNSAKGSAMTLKNKRSIRISLTAFAIFLLLVASGYAQTKPDALADLERRLVMTQWPERETVTDRSQGVQLATMKALVGYWQSSYDWRIVEARLNALPQFVTTIDGLDIHFIHVRSKHPSALPVIITLGWPGWIIEELKIIGPLTNPTAHGGNAEDAFDVVIPSLPGYGFQESRPRPAGTPSTSHAGGLYS